jgi:hypothetical protein
MDHVSRSLGPTHFTAACITAGDPTALRQTLSLPSIGSGSSSLIEVAFERLLGFVRMYVRKEAVLSSQIEGAQSTLTDLLRLEVEANQGSPVDVEEQFFVR